MKLLFIVKIYHDSDKYFENKDETFFNKSYEEINKIFCDFYCNWLSEFYLILKKKFEAEIIFVNTINLIKESKNENFKSNYFKYLDYLIHDYKPNFIFSNTEDKIFLSKIESKNSYNILWKSSKCNEKDEIFSGKIFNHIISDNGRILEFARKKNLNNSMLMASVPDRLLEKNNFLKRKNKIFFTGSLGFEYEERKNVIKEVLKNKLDIEIRSRDIKDFGKYSEKILRLIPLLENSYKKNNLSSISKPPFFGQELFTHMSKFKYILNTHSEFDRNIAINYRVFESLAVGCVLFTDSNKKLNEYFIDENHLLVYKNKKDLIFKIKELKNNDKLADEISQNGFELMKKKHTTSLRVKEFMNIFDL